MSLISLKTVIYLHSQKTEKTDNERNVLCRPTLLRPQNWTVGLYLEYTMMAHRAKKVKAT